MKTRINIAILLTFLLLSVPVVVRAQVVSFDVLSIEAFIQEHKSIRSELLIRAGVEEANEVLHQNSKAQCVDYDSLNVKLDRYTKCFEVIDEIYQGAVTIMNFSDTYSDVSEKIVGLNKIISDFIELRTLRGDILSSDAKVFTACSNMISNCTTEAEGLILSLGELASYFVPALGRECPTRDLMTILTRINESLDNIRDCISSTYSSVWKYIYIRTHFYKKEHLGAKTMREMARDAVHSAFEHWRGVRRKVGYK